MNNQMKPRTHADALSWTTQPHLCNFHDRVARVLESEGPDAIWSCEEAFQGLLSDGVMKAVIDVELEKMIRDFTYIPFRGNESGLILMQAEDYSLSVRQALPVPQASVVQSFAHHMLFGLLTRGPVMLARFEQPVPEPNDVFDRRRALVFRGEQELHEGSSLRIRAARDLFTVRYAAGTQIYIIFATRNFLPLAWEYSVQTLCPSKAIAVNPGSTRLQYASRLLGQMACKESIPNLVQLSEQHPEHFVRWTAIQTILTLDMASGQVVLRKGLTDEHPHVRKACRQALNILEPTDPK